MWGATHFRTRKSQSKKINGLCSVGCKSNFRCTGYSSHRKLCSGTAIILEGKFVRWIKKPDLCGCKNQTRSMRMYGRDAVKIVQAREEIKKSCEHKKLSTAVTMHTTYKMTSKLVGRAKKKGVI